MEKFNKKGLIIFAVFLAFLAVILHFRPKKTNFEEFGIVKDNSRFYTVASAVSKYVNYVRVEDTDSILVLLNNKYVKEYGIDQSNVFSYINKVPENASFVARKMYVEQVEKHVYKYYVYGILEEELINESPKNVGDLYVIVYLNEDGMTFSVEPYNGEVFK